MRNLTIITTADQETLMRAFRHAFMEKTATWSVLVEVVDTHDRAYDIAEGSEDAFVSGARFEDVLFDEADFPAVPSEISQGCDVLARSGRDYIGMSLLGKALIHEIEESIMPIYDAHVVVFGTDSLAIDAAYHAARAGVSDIVLLDSSRDRALNNVEAFMETFTRMRTKAVDTDQSTFGHLSIKRAYEYTDIRFGVFDTAVGITAKADIVINATPHSNVPVSFLSRLNLSSSQIVVDLYDEDNVGPLISLGNIAGADCVPAQRVYERWGRDTADTLVELMHEGF